LRLSIENRTADAARLAMATNLVMQTAVASAAVLLRSPVAVWSARSLSFTGLLPASLWLLPRGQRRATLRPRLPRGLPAGFWRFATLTSAGALLSYLVASRIEVVALQRFGDARSVGVYALAFGIAIQLRSPIDALLTPLMPSVAGIVAVHPHLAGATLVRTLRVAAVLSGGVMVFVPCAAGLIPIVYGEQFATVSRLLLPLTAVAVFQSMTSPLLAFARAQRITVALIWAGALSLVLDIALAVALVPIWGVWGATIATTAAQLSTIAVLVTLQVRRGTVTWFGLSRAYAPFLLAVGVSFSAVLLGEGAGAHSMVLIEALYLGSVPIWLLLVRWTIRADEVADLATAVGSLPATITRVAVPVIGWLDRSGARTPPIRLDAEPVTSEG
jgi:O-antigen/teichoic acid export membrane protein